MSVEPGKYRAIAVSRPQLTETKTEKPYVAVDFRITQGEHAGEVLPWAGWLSTEKGEARTVAALRYAGWKGDDITDIGELDQEVQIVVESEEGSDGKTRTRIKWVNAAVPPLADAKAKAIRDRLRAKAAGVPSVAGAPPVTIEDPFGDP